MTNGIWSRNCGWWVDKKLTWFIRRHYDEAIYNSDTYLRTSNKYVRGWDKGILHCSAVVQVFFFPKEGQGLKHYIFCRSTCFAQWKSEYICPAILQHGWKITHLSMIYHFFSDRQVQLRLVTSHLQDMSAKFIWINSTTSLWRHLKWWLGKHLKLALFPAYDRQMIPHDLVLLSLSFANLPHKRRGIGSNPFFHGSSKTDLRLSGSVPTPRRSGWRPKQAPLGPSPWVSWPAGWNALHWSNMAGNIFSELNGGL